MGGVGLLITLYFKTSSLTSSNTRSRTLLNDLSLPASDFWRCSFRETGGLCSSEVRHLGRHKVVHTSAGQSSGRLHHQWDGKVMEWLLAACENMELLLLLVAQADPAFAISPVRNPGQRPPSQATVAPSGRKFPHFPSTPGSLVSVEKKSPGRVLLVLASVCCCWCFPRVGRVLLNMYWN